jgi:hypothetical protein
MSHMLDVQMALSHPRASTSSADASSWQSTFIICMHRRA